MKHADNYWNKDTYKTACFSEIYLRAIELVEGHYKFFTLKDDLWKEGLDFKFERLTNSIWIFNLSS
jgi:hypothetical protein